MRARISDSDKNLATFLTTHHIDVWHLPIVYVACKRGSDLGHGPNKPTVTIIGVYSASCHHGALIYPLEVGGEFQNLTIICLDVLRDTSLMSDMLS